MFVYRSFWLLESAFFSNNLFNKGTKYEGICLGFESSRFHTCGIFIEHHTLVKAHYNFSLFRRRYSFSFFLFLYFIKSGSFFLHFVFRNISLQHLRIVWQNFALQIMKLLSTSVNYFLFRNPVTAKSDYLAWIESVKLVQRECF